MVIIYLHFVMAQLDNGRIASGSDDNNTLKVWE